MKYFLAKTEPSTYSIDDFEQEQTTLWDGVHNYEAINFIKTMKPGDVVYIYHSMKDKSIVGTATVVEDPFLNTDDSRFSWAVKLKFTKKINGPSLADFKKEPDCATFKLVTHSRLSVMSVPEEVVTWIQSRI